MLSVATQAVKHRWFWQEAADLVLFSGLGAISSIHWMQDEREKITHMYMADFIFFQIY